MIDHAAYGPVQDYVQSTLIMRGVAIRPNGDMSAFRQRQHQAEPKYQFWTLLLAAAVHAEALPIRAEHVEKAIADLES